MLTRPRRKAKGRQWKLPAFRHIVQQENRTALPMVSDLLNRATRDERAIHRFQELSDEFLCIR